MAIVSSDKTSNKFEFELDKWLILVSCMAFLSAYVLMNDVARSVQCTSLEIGSFYLQI